MVGSVKLSSGHDFPILGLGTWKSQPGEVARAVKHALKTGYRHIDCAFVYGNEAEVGQGLKEAMEELNIPREEIFVTSKLWNCFHHPGFNFINMFFKLAFFLPLHQAFASLQVAPTN
jgi:diketogulonate reductase-like aldo/keto reductase